jgi:hypothetical protein
MRSLPTNPILAAPAGAPLTGVYQQDSSSKPPQAHSVLHAEQTRTAMVITM